MVSSVPDRDCEVDVMLLEIKRKVVLGDCLVENITSTRTAPYGERGERC